jgi:hypothetical protein
MRYTLVSLASIMLGVATGCYPTLPPHLGEGTEVLGPGRVNLAVAGGAAPFVGKDATGASVNQFAAGIETRVRTGIGANSEIGAAVFGGFGTTVGGGDPPFALGGKLSYKWGPLPWLAFVVDGGAMDFAVASVAVFSGDLAVITAPYTWANGMQFYVGAKGAFSVPVLQNATNVNEAIIVPIGLRIPTSEKVRFFVEGGPIAGFAQQSSAGGSSSTNSFGGYGTLSLTFLLR